MNERIVVKDWRDRNQYFQLIGAEVSSFNSKNNVVYQGFGCFFNVGFFGSTRNIFSAFYTDYKSIYLLFDNKTIELTDQVLLQKKYIFPYVRRFRVFESNLTLIDVLYMQEFEENSFPEEDYINYLVTPLDAASTIGCFCLIQKYKGNIENPEFVKEYEHIMQMRDGKEKLDRCISGKTAQKF